MGATNFLESIFSQKEVMRTGKFLLGFGIAFLAMNFLFLFVPLQLIEYFFAAVSLFVLKLFGFGGEIVFGEPVILHLAAVSLPIAISYLCTGILEATIIASAVLSSFGIGLKKRIFGTVGGILVLVAFNIVRIVASILAIVFLGFSAGEFSHDLLFRAFLFFTVAGYYFVWFRWATKQDAFSKSGRIY